jgi:hypothetical protein
MVVVVALSWDVLLADEIFPQRLALEETLARVELGCSLNNRQANQSIIKITRCRKEINATTNTITTIMTTTTPTTTTTTSTSTAAAAAAH